MFLYDPPCPAGTGCRGSSLSLHSSLHNTRLSCPPAWTFVWRKALSQVPAGLSPAAQPPCTTAAQSEPPAAPRAASSTRFSTRMWWTRAGMEVGMSQSPHLSPVASAPPRASTVWQLSDLATPAVPGLASTGRHIPLGLGELWPRRRVAGPFCQCLLHFPQRGKAPLAGTHWGASMQQEAAPNHLWGHCLCPRSILRPAPAKMRVRKRKCHLLPGTTSVRKCTK